MISKHISNTWLWDRVRVSGGAYGGFCNFDTHSGTYYCHVLVYTRLPMLISLLFKYLCRNVFFPVLSGSKFTEDT